MKDLNQNDIISDIRKIAAKCNANELSDQEYIQNGGKYPISIFEEYEDEIGSFQNNLELAGLKFKK